KCWKCCPPAVKQALYRVNTFRLTRLMIFVVNVPNFRQFRLIFLRHKIVDCRSGRRLGMLKYITTPVSYFHEKKKKKEQQLRKYANFLASNQ
ncbi:hypothetical protein L9F63_003528, partial [Diploptera punctata]